VVFLNTMQTGDARKATPSETEFFQAVIDDHRRRPRHRGPLPTATRGARRENPLCGDRCALQFQLEPAADAAAPAGAARILAAGFTGAGCALSQASASLLTVAATGRTVGEFQALAAQVEAWVRVGAKDEFMPPGDLAALAAARAYPARHACALLAWQAALAALAEPGVDR
jgi:nitrogen fixation NifU-like protein